MQNIDSSLSDSPEPTTSANYIKILNDSIKLVPRQMSWDEAKKYCKEDGANLASVRSDWTQVYIELMAMNLNSTLWIGLNKTKGYFRYVSGWHMKLTNWGRYEPRRTGTCVFVDVDGTWKTSDCNQTRSSVCMKSTDEPPIDKSGDFPGVCPEDPEEIFPWRQVSWKPFKGSCYLFFSEEKTWSDASVSCVSHGGMLASIEDPAEQEFIQNNIGTFRDSHSSYWIGLFKTKRGKWLWLDKTVMDFTNWRSDETDTDDYFSSRFSRDSHGLISTSDGMWSRSRGWLDRPYICKTAKVLLKDPSPSSVSPNIRLIPSVRGRIILAIMLVIAGLAVGTVVAFFLLKKSGRHLPIPNNKTNFENPLFFSNNPSKPGLVDRKTLVETADEENTQPVITI
ncbi:macrophage mannose receptor 1-like [Kryptolebias marmoratus]|uniref:macrophage mannose receptor 1-like n=1 Tax=Kryptolebias marmoratus TaxID=37003 RepID=UPI0007F8BFAD|nr:macrophage mannose receptor 1-like [Kryptolebias marmoratus]